MSEEIRRSTEPVEWKPVEGPRGTAVEAPYCGLCGRRHFSTTAFCGARWTAEPLTAVDPMKRFDPVAIEAAAYRRGMLRAAEIVEATIPEYRGGTGSCDFARADIMTEIAAWIRTEAGAGIP